MKTNEEAKQEVIKKAYGPFYEPNKELINHKGEVTGYIGKKMHVKGLNMIYFDGMAIPESIYGFINNNGWIRIEPDGSNLPTDEKIRYRVYSIHNTNKFKVDYDWYEVTSLIRCDQITHYKPIIPEKPPVY